MAKFRICVVILTVLYVMPGTAQDWSWFSRSTPIAIDFDAVSVSGDSVLHVGERNVYRGPLFGVAEAVLTPGEFVYIEDRPRLMKIPDGSLLILGSSRGQTAFGAFHMRDLHASPERYGEARFDGARFPIGFGDDVAVIDDLTLRLRNTYSFDAGATWYHMRNDSVMGQRTYAHRVAGTIIAKNEVTGHWFEVDTSSRQYVATSSYDNAMCQFAVLPNGAAMAIRCISGDEVDLLTRRTEQEAWVSVPELATAEGTTIQPGSVVFLRSKWLLTTQTGKAIFVLDSGRVIEYDGSSVRVRTLDSKPINGVFLEGSSSRRHVHGKMMLVYQVQENGATSYTAIVYSLLDEQVEVYRGLRYKPVALSARGYLSLGPYHTDWEAGRTRPTASVYDDNGLPIGQPFLPLVTACGAVPIATADNGELFTVDADPGSITLHPVRTAGRVDVTSFWNVLKVVAHAPLHDTAIILPSRTPTIIGPGGLKRRLPTIPVPFSAPTTCGAVDAQGRILIGGTFIVRSNDTSWDALPYPEQFTDANVVVSSMTTSADGAIFAGARGHGVGSSTTDSFQWRRGGIAVTTDAGTTWRALRLPRDEQWVEQLTTGPDDALYCWATTLVFDSAYGGSYPLPRYGTARVYRSTDGGDSWSTIFTDEADDATRRTVADHQWSISFAPNGALAISTRSAVYVAPTPTSAFTALDDLPFNVRVGGCAFTSDNALWVTGSHGIHRRSPTASSVHDDDEGDLVLQPAPNPAADRLIIRAHANGRSSDLPDHIMLTSVDGLVSRRLVLSGSTYETPTSGLPQGVYVVSARRGALMITTKVLVLH